MLTFLSKNYEHGNPRNMSGIVVNIYLGYCLIKSFTGKTAERRARAYQREHFAPHLTQSEKLDMSVTIRKRPMSEG